MRDGAIFGLGSLRPRFRGRLMIPIRDTKGHTIGFGARALKDGDEPKYMNSPQSPMSDALSSTLS